MFEKMEKEIEKFKYLLNCLREEEILNGTKRNEKDSII
jgi:hypothetical protein